MTHRFFVPSNQVSKSGASITGDDVNHIRLVLRMKPGDEILVLDGTGRTYACSIKTIKEDKVNCKIISSRSAKSEPETKITLIQSIPRESKMDFIMQKCTELGVSRIIPTITERTIIKLNEEKKEKRHNRWQKIIKEAAEQAGRGIIPKIDEILRFDEALRFSKDHELCVIPWEMEEKTSLKQVLDQAPKNILIAIGPEGGFSKTEVEKAVRAGFKPVSLGKRILRTETAGIAVLSMISYALEM